MRQLPLWDQVSMKVLGFFSVAELAELEREGLASRRCRACGSGDHAVKTLSRPKMAGDVELWLAWLDDRPVTKHCEDHVLQAHATSELRAQPTRGYVPRTTKQADYFVRYNPQIWPVVARPVLLDAVHDQLIKGL